VLETAAQTSAKSELCGNVLVPHFCWGVRDAEFSKPALRARKQSEKSNAELADRVALSGMRRVGLMFALQVNFCAFSGPSVLFSALSLAF